MAAPALELPRGIPRTVILKSKYNGKYIRYTNEEITFQRYLQATADAAASPLAKFHVEASTTSTYLVHIRCAYNNKYWAAAAIGEPWIAAVAKDPEEDQSNWSCTLFEPVLAESDNRVIRFRHVQLNRYATLFDDSSSPLHNFVQAVSEHPDLTLLTDAYEMVDRESLVVLPQLAAFKGGDGLYIQPSGGSLIFYGKDIGDEYVGSELFTTSAGAIRIKNIATNQFWRKSNDLDVIGADSNDTSEKDPDTVFWPVQVDDNIIALRCQGNNKICIRHTYVQDRDVFAAELSTISQKARIQVEELVISREIYDVAFRVPDARIYDENIIVAASGFVRNEGPNLVNQKVTLKHTETKSHMWQGNVTLKLGVKITIQTGVPMLVAGAIEVSAEASRSTTWGDSETTSEELTNEYDAVVSPHTLMTVNLVATRGICDVPFSYTQRDIGLDGIPVVTYQDDGVFTGVNSFNYYYDTKEEPLTPPPSASTSD
ncbi:unnamed protein product [Linum trigynum]|uniref:Agglutinin domain-containing protein n=1 Tax=Linum trigynum TaxID=586398 RepID=A0AAV2GL50_9ROSI